MTVVAIDGPVGSGKSTVARRVAERLGYLYLDTGAMYRAVGLLATEAGVELGRRGGRGADRRRRRPALRRRRPPVRRRPRRERRSSAAWRWARPPRSCPCCRACAGCWSSGSATLGAGADIVMEGRDIGTNVFPDAEVKVFLTARPEVRAARRADELCAKGEEVDVDDVLAALVERDRRDSEREVAPLRKAADAVEVDTSDLTLERGRRRPWSPSSERRWPRDAACGAIRSSDTATRACTPSCAGSRSRSSAACTAAGSGARRTCRRRAP